jgi:hypothetical protein
MFGSSFNQWFSDQYFAHWILECNVDDGFIIIILFCYIFFKAKQVVINKLHIGLKDNWVIFLCYLNI